MKMVPVLESHLYIFEINPVYLRALFPGASPTCSQLNIEAIWNLQAPKPLLKEVLYLSLFKKKKKKVAKC